MNQFTRKLRVLQVPVWAILLLSGVLQAADDRPYMGIQQETERELQNISRQTGFQGPLVDRMHARIGENLHLFFQYYELANRTSGESVDLDDSGRMVYGKDGSGKAYLRVLIDQKNSVGGFTFQHPVIRKTHAYLYPAADGKTLDKIVVQLYQVNIMESSNYSRELRRVIHPIPRPWEGDGIEFQSNKDLTVEYYFRPAGQPPFPSDASGVPLPDVGVDPDTTVKLLDEESPLQFENQVRVIDLYQRVLFLVNGKLHFWNEQVRLEKAFRVEQALDF